MSGLTVGSLWKPQGDSLRVWQSLLGSSHQLGDVVIVVVYEGTHVHMWMARGGQSGFPHVNPSVSQPMFSPLRISIKCSYLTKSLITCSEFHCKFVANHYCCKMPWDVLTRYCDINESVVSPLSALLPWWWNAYTVVTLAHVSPVGGFEPLSKDKKFK